MGLGDKVAAVALAHQVMATIPIEKDALAVPGPIEILARVSARMGEPEAAIAALQKLVTTPHGCRRAAHSRTSSARPHVRFPPE
jgi:hypothetical protein